jgi:hypothetical protein
MPSHPEKRNATRRASLIFPALPFRYIRNFRAPIPSPTLNGRTPGERSFLWATDGFG